MSEVEELYPKIYNQSNKSFFISECYSLINRSEKIEEYEFDNENNNIENNK